MMFRVLLICTYIRLDGWSGGTGRHACLRSMYPKGVGVRVSSPARKMCLYSCNSSDKN